MRAHTSTEEILDDIRLRIKLMPLECGPGVTIPALPPVDRHNPLKVKVYGGWKHFIMHVVLAQEEVSKASRRQVACSTALGVERGQSRCGDGQPTSTERQS
jgi:hypothetical protein